MPTITYNNKIYSVNELDRGLYCTAYECDELPDKVFIEEEPFLDTYTKECLYSLRHIDNPHIPKVDRIRQGLYVAKRYKIAKYIPFKATSRKVSYDMLGLKERMKIHRSISPQGEYLKALYRNNENNDYDYLLTYYRTLYKQGTVTGKMLEALLQITYSYYSSYTKLWYLDTHLGNLAEDEKGNVVFLDILAPGE